MPLLLIETGHCNVDLKPSPIEPSWIIEGNPEARLHVLWTSADGSAETLIWSCTLGKFNRFYDFDETIVILERRHPRELERGRHLEAALLVDLAELLFQFCHQSVYALRGLNVGRLSRQRTVLDDFDCELNTLVFLNQKCLLS